MQTVIQTMMMDYHFSTMDTPYTKYIDAKNRIFIVLEVVNKIKERDLVPVRVKLLDFYSEKPVEIEYAEFEKIIEEGKLKKYTH